MLVLYLFLYWNSSNGKIAEFSIFRELDTLNYEERDSEDIILRVDFSSETRPTEIYILLSSAIRSNRSDTRRRIH